MATHTATQPTTHELSPQSGAALSSLDISLDAELAQHRHNCQPEGLGQEEVSSSIESNFESDSAFDVEPTEVDLVVAPPPVPPNKKLLAAGFYDRDISDPNRSALPFLAQQESDHLKEEACGPSDISVSSLVDSLIQADETKAISRETAHTIVPQTQTLSVQSTPIQHQKRVAERTSHRNSASSGYQASFEELIEHLEDKSGQTSSTKLATGLSYKTVSLLAGAVLGFSGFVTGLGASYMMSNPPVSQRSANAQASSDIEGTVASPPESPLESTTTQEFDPPGPNLSSIEFVKLKIDNLSSLQMPSHGLITPSAINPSAINSGQLSPTPSNLVGLPATPAPAETIETQTAILPVGMTYYVTVPFTSERSLEQIRQVISEAFVRQFADGNRIQIGVFDNPQSAKQLLEKLKDNNIEAEVYGPTTE